MLGNDIADYGYICDITCCWQWRPYWETFSHRTQFVFACTCAAVARYILAENAVYDYERRSIAVTMLIAPPLPLYADYLLFWTMRSGTRSGLLVKNFATGSKTVVNGYSCRCFRRVCSINRFEFTTSESFLFIKRMWRYNLFTREFLRLFDEWNFICYIIFVYYIFSLNTLGNVSRAHWIHRASCSFSFSEFIDALGRNSTIILHTRKNNDLLSRTVGNDCWNLHIWPENSPENLELANVECLGFQSPLKWQRMSMSARRIN